ncbi:MAG TPA: putative leader peptide [Pseudonocardia sp.]|nr:putative leader peptide [Pseudonocardia sp.]
MRNTHAVPAHLVPAQTWSKRRHVDLCRTQTAICR